MAPDPTHGTRKRHSVYHNFGKPPQFVATTAFAACLQRHLTKTAHTVVETYAPAKSSPAINSPTSESEPGKFDRLIPSARSVQSRLNFVILFRTKSRPAILNVHWKTPRQRRRRLQEYMLALPRTRFASKIRRRITW